MGDLVYSLSIAKILEVETLFIDGGCDFVKFNWDSANFISPLLKYQSYIERAELYNDQPYDYNYGLHPENKPVVVGTNLTEFHASKFNLNNHKNIYDPWLEAPKLSENTILNKKVVINRSKRYHGNPQFYADFLKFYRPEHLLFLGLPDEYSSFNQDFGLKDGQIEYIETLDVMTLASIINTIPCFVGNESLICSIATGLGKNCFIEYCPNAANYIYPRQNINYF